MTNQARPPQGPVAVIINPRSARGRAGRRWKSLRLRVEAALGPVQAQETRGSGHAIELARSCLRQGCRTVIAVGGDGTISEVANGLLEENRSVEEGAALGILPQGSASDLRRTLRIPLNEEDALEVIRRGTTRRMDVLRVDFQAHAGGRQRRYSVNVTSFGIGGAVADRFNRNAKPLGGRLSFLLAAFTELLVFPGRQVTLELDERERRQFLVSNIAVGNAQYHGGGMHVCPWAAVDDGRMDVTVFNRFSPWDLLRSIRSLYNGKIYDHPKVEFHRAARLRARAEEPTFLELDGEPLGRLPVEITVMPGVLSVYAPE